MRKSIGVVLHGTDRCASPNLYMDLSLRSDRGKYLGLLDELWKRGWLDFTRNPFSRAGLFCVRKKSGKLRLIIDIRRSNAMFHFPLDMHLVAVEQLSEIESDSG